MSATVRLVTAILPSARHTGQFDVVADGECMGTLSIDAIERLGLRSGAPLDERASLALQDEARRQRTYDRALAMLALRAHGTLELRRALLKKGEPAGDVDAVITRLAAAGLLDDAAFARLYVRSKLVGGGLSRRRLQAELARKGIARDIAESAIADVIADEEVDEDAVLRALAERKLRTLHAADAQIRRRRLYAFLARRGYDPDAIRRTMSGLLRGGGDDSG